MMRVGVIATGFLAHFTGAASLDIKCSNEVCSLRVAITNLTSSTYINSKIGTENVIGFPELKLQGPGFMQLKNVNSDCQGKIRLGGAEGDVILNSDTAVSNATAAITALADSEYTLTMEDPDRCLQYLLMASDDQEAFDVLKKKAEVEEEKKVRAVHEVEAANGCGPQNFTLEAMVLFDASSSRDHLTPYQNLLNSMPSLRLGFAAFTDKPLSPVGSSDDFCYRSLVPLQQGSAAMSSLLAMDRSVMASGGDEKNNPLEALLNLMGASQFSSERSDSTGRYVLRSAIVHVHSKWNEAGMFASLPAHPGSIVQGTECSTYDYPTAQQVGSLFQENGVSVFFVVHGNQTLLEEYQHLLLEMGCSGSVVLSEAPSHSPLREAIEKGIHQLCARMPSSV